MKKCPYCAEEIQEEAIKCRHCGEFVERPSEPESEPAEEVVQTDPWREFSEEYQAAGDPHKRRLWKRLNQWQRAYVTSQFGVVEPSQKKKVGRPLAYGCLAVVGLFVVVVIILASLNTKDSTRSRKGTSKQNSPTPDIKRPTEEASDSSIIATVEATLASVGVNVQEVKIADGKSKGGERVLIVTYFHTRASEADRAGEIVKVLESCYVANEKMNSGFESVAAVAGASADRTSAVISVRAGEVASFMVSRDPSTYMKSWKVILYDPNFLPVTARQLGWKVTR